MIISKQAKEIGERLLKKSIKYCEDIKATEIHNIAYLGAGDFRIMYYTGEGTERKMEAVILSTEKL